MMDNKDNIDTQKRWPKPHSRLGGMRGQYVNQSVDFSISLNKWPVCFRDSDGVLINLVDGCIVATWLNYITHLRGHPMPESNSCQRLLKYMLLNRVAFVKTYHDRMFCFSSGTKFVVVSVPIHYDDLEEAALSSASVGAALHAALASHYADSKFVKVMPLGEAAWKEEGLLERGIFLRPDSLNNTNKLQVFVYCNDEKRTCVVAARLDHLGKGASGAAVQNLNLALGPDETTGLVVLA